MTPLARALNALERLNARAARPDRQRDPSEPRAGGASATDGDTGSDGGYDATERAWWGAGVPGPYPMTEKPMPDPVVLYLTDEIAKREDFLRQADDLIGALRDNVDHANDETANMAADLLAKDDTIERLAADLASRTGDLDDAEARCERLWLQLQEAANVPSQGMCGGCEDKGSHRKHCHANPSYSREAEWADQAESLGDLVGPNNMRASSALWRAAGILRGPDESEIPWDVQTAFERRSL